MATLEKYLKRWNGSSWDIIYPKTTIANVENLSTILTNLQYAMDNIHSTYEKKSNLGTAAYKADTYFAVAGHTHTDVISAARGGTGQTSLIYSANVLLNALSESTSTPSDNDYYISQFAGGGTTNTTYHRRPISALYNYMKSKSDALYASKSHDHNSSYYTKTQIEKDLIRTRRFLINENGVPTSNLGTPAIAEMALFEKQFDNKTAFYDISKISFQTSTNGTTWTEYTGFSDVDKKKFVGGDSTSNIYIPFGTPYFRIKVQASVYVWLNALYMYWETRGNKAKVHIYKQFGSNALEQHTNSDVETSGWPGHLYLPFSSIPFSPGGTLGSHWNTVYIVFIPNWTGSSTDISLYNMQIWGGYPAGKRTVYSTDENANVTFPAAVKANEFYENNVKLSDKFLDKVTGATSTAQVYGKHANGTQVMYLITTGNAGDTIPFRGPDKQIKVAPTPVSDIDATSKKYVDELHRVDVLFKGDTALNNTTYSSITLSNDWENYQYLILTFEDNEQDFFTGIVNIGHNEDGSAYMMNNYMYFYNNLNLTPFLVECSDRNVNIIDLIEIQTNEDIDEHLRINEIKGIR